MSTDRDPEHGAGCPIGLLASTLMLMTQLAEPAACALAQAQRQSLERRIAANLQALQQHAAIPPGLRQVAASLCPRWTPAPDPQAASAAHTRPHGKLLH